MGEATGPVSQAPRLSVLSACSSQPLLKSVRPRGSLGNGSVCVLQIVSRALKVLGKYSTA